MILGGLKVAFNTPVKFLLSVLARELNSWLRLDTRVASVKKFAIIDLTGGEGWQIKVRS